MERLTKVDGAGQNDLIRCFDCDTEKAGEHLENCGYCEEGWRRALDKLAAYEDTGLEPGEIPNALEMAQLVAAMDRLQKYEDAKKDGRLVVLPCKVGDTVPVVHGVWEFSHTSSDGFAVVKCSNCGHDAFAIAFYVKEGHYCPCCGAKMGGNSDA